MCLIKSGHHLDALDKPFIAEDNILVYKILRHHGNFDLVCRTPFRGFPITFINGICNISDYLEKNNSDIISLGLHSFYREECACLCKYTELTKHYAIIPKGSEYFIGLNGEIVSNNLIIFETYNEFLKYRKQNTYIEL